MRYTVTTSPINVASGESIYDPTKGFVPYGSLNPTSGIHAWYGTLNPVTNITLPDGSGYSFKYYTDGELRSMTLPTGGIITYAYTDFIDSANTENLWLTSYQRGNDPATSFTPRVGTTCRNYSSGCIEYVTHHKPNGDETIYEMSLVNGAWNTGRWVYTGSVPFIIGPIRKNDPRLVKPLSSSFSYNQYSNDCLSQFPCPGSNHLTQTLITTDLYNSNGTKTGYTQAQSIFDKLTGKVQAVKEWDISSNVASENVSVAPGTTPARETDYSYTGIYNDPYQNTILDSVGNKAGLTTYSYTPTAQVTAGVPHHGTPNSGGPYLQSIAHWLNTASVSPSTTYTTDDTGMVLGIKDPLQNSTTMSYQCGNSLPLTLTNALSQTTQYTYDCDSGALTAVQDPNDLRAGRAGTVYGYEPLAGRLSSVSSPFNGIPSLSSKYTQSPDSSSRTYTYSDSKTTQEKIVATPSPPIISTSVVDEFGRPFLATTGAVTVKTTYDINGRLLCTSNPFDAASGASLDNTCTTSYDGLDRPLIKQEPDGSTLTWSYSANSTTESDEKGNSWTRWVDAFNRLVNITEPAPGDPAATVISYDGLSNVSSVAQFGASSIGPPIHYRTFTYDSLSRKICSAHPESSSSQCPASATSLVPAGVTTFRYDLAGNLTIKEDSRGVATALTYDALNRLTAKSYHAAVRHADWSFQYPSLYFYDGYDATGSNMVDSYNGIGHMTGMNDQAGEETWQYFANGRIFDDQRTTQGTRWSSSYFYNLAGQLIYDDSGVEIQYDSSGRPVSSSVNLLTMAGGQSIAQTVADVQQASYADSGALSSLSKLLIDGSLATTSYKYNNRLQLSRISTSLTPPGVPPSASDPALMDFKYNYNPSPNNNANIANIVDEVNANATQQFSYDTLNRLNRAWTCNSVGGVAYDSLAECSHANTMWGQQYSIDPFGNLTQRQDLPGTLMTEPGVATTTVAGTNRLAGNTYDNMGNVEFDGVNSYRYDGEDRPSQINQTSSQYDGLGRRVWTSDGYSQTCYFYNPDNTLAMSNDCWLGIPQVTYTYFNGQRTGQYSVNADSATPNNYVYPFYDHLGSERLALAYNWQYNSTGPGGYYSLNLNQTKSTFFPFGGGVSTSGGGSRSSDYAGLTYNSSFDLHQGTYRDYSAPQGRWMSADPADDSMDVNNPQTLNRYAYANNMVTASNDPSGLSPEGTGSSCVSCFANPIGFLIRALSSWSPTFHGSTKPRPIWDEHGSYRPVPFTGVADILGLPQAGCEFGACGNGLLQGGGPPSCGADNKDVCGSNFGYYVGLFFDALKDTIRGPQPSARCVAEAKTFQANFIKASPHSRTIGLFGGIATSGAMNSVPGGAYLGYKFSQSQIDAAYTSALRSCTAAGR